MSDKDKGQREALPAWFISEKMDEMGRDMKEVLVAAKGTSVSVDGLLHEVQNEIKPEIGKLQDEVKSLTASQGALMQAHARDCPAYQNFMVRAVKGSTLSKLPGTPVASQGLVGGLFSALPLSKSMVTLFVGLGLSAAVAIFILFKTGIL